MLSRRERLILDTLLPSGVHPDLPYGLFDAGFAEFWSDFEQTALPLWPRGFRAALWIAIWVAPLLIRRLPPLSLYGRPTRERALEAMERSRLAPIRQVVGLLKTVVGFSYGADSHVREAIGYPVRRELSGRQVET
jgi:hypothetical protein